MAWEEVANFKGARGAGLPPGGLPGQIPVKQSETDLDIDWEDQAAAPTVIDCGEFT